MTKTERYELIGKLRDTDPLAVQDVLCTLTPETIDDILSGPEGMRVWAALLNLAPQFARPFCFTHWRKHLQCPR